MRRALLILFLLVVFGVAWAYLFTGTLPWGPRLTPRAGPLASIELSWFGSNRTITASDRCARVILTMRKARQSPVPASPPFGTLTLHCQDGTMNQFYLQPSGRFNGLELVGESGGYSISMGEMLDALKKAGLLTADQK
jgi:hypothetical protein